MSIFFNSIKLETYKKFNFIIRKKIEIYIQNKIRYYLGDD